MFFLPGWLVGLLTFPGVIAHEIAHRLFAEIGGVPVYEICYFRIGNPAGYVIHKPPTTLKTSFLISVGPLIVNTALCSVITFSAMFPLFILKAKQYNGVFAVLIWLGFSFGMHSFPSNEDMQNFTYQVKTTRRGGITLLSAKFFEGVLRVANALRVIWFDFIYAFLVSMALPYFLGFL